MNNKGFSLIELLMALIIFAVGGLAIGAMQIHATANNYSSNQLSRAVAIAQTKVEYLNSLDFDDGELSVNKNHKEEKVSGKQFLVNYDVDALGSYGKIITVTVKWNDKHGHSIVLSTIRAQ